MPRFGCFAMSAYLLCLAAGSVFFADSAWKSVTGYRSEYGFDRQFEAGPALVSRVVMVVLDGLRTDQVAAIPAFRRLAARGTSGTMRVTVPALSNPGRAALVTGAWPEVSGVTTNSGAAPPPVQSLFSLAVQGGARPAVFGTNFWPAAFGDYIDHRGAAPKPAPLSVGGLVSWQDQACAEALGYIGASDAAFRVVGLLAGDEAGHTYGGESAEYSEVIAAVDQCLGRIVESLGPDTVVMAVSDHGHIHRWGKGGHGGLEPEVLFAPFATSGPSIRRSAPIRAQIVDIAPTVSTLLGLPIPANNQGRVLWEALEVPTEHQAHLRRLEREQRAALKAFLPDREAALAEQRSKRLPIAGAAALWFLAVGAGVAYRQRLGAVALAVVAFAIAYAAFFFSFQLGTSVSAAVRQEYLNYFLARNVAAAALGFGVAAVCLFWWAGRASELAVRVGVLISSGLGLMVTATYFRFGLRMDGWMVELEPGFKAYLSLLAILGVAIGVLVVLAANRVLPGGRERTG